ncbi:uncharacterized protein BcabD6B2_44360 [Babesia caballi]|uniref:Uncharacterized protein n=1 Tax=Babesia caballi TaxID=5871 RepID=A0AAV4LYU0_BABCB|nr:hypothetical protein BcabD6B2_44360 [Babesia caballi]
MGILALLGRAHASGGRRKQSVHGSGVDDAAQAAVDLERTLESLGVTVAEHDGLAASTRRSRKTSGAASPGALASGSRVGRGRRDAGHGVTQHLDQVDQGNGLRYLHAGGNNHLERVAEAVAHPYHVGHLVLEQRHVPGDGLGESPPAVLRVARSGDERDGVIGDQKGVTLVENTRRVVAQRNQVQHDVERQIVDTTGTLPVLAKRLETASHLVEGRLLVLAKTDLAAGNHDAQNAVVGAPNGPGLVGLGVQLQREVLQLAVKVQQVVRVGARVGEHAARDGAHAPVGELVRLVQVHAEEVLDEGGKRVPAAQAKHVGGLEGVEQVDHVDTEVALKPEDVALRAVHHLQNARVGGHLVQPPHLVEHLKGVNDPVVAGAGDLHQADEAAVALAAVVLDVDRDDAVALEHGDHGLQVGERLHHAALLARRSRPGNVDVGVQQAAAAERLATAV